MPLTAASRRSRTWPRYASLASFPLLGRGRDLTPRGTIELVDLVFPDAPIRQGVLSMLPHRLRDLLAWNQDRCLAVSRVAVRTVLGFLRRRARRDGVADGQWRRRGRPALRGALDLNVHVRAGAGRRVHERRWCHPEMAVMALSCSPRPAPARAPGLPAARRATAPPGPRDARHRSDGRRRPRSERPRRSAPAGTGSSRAGSHRRRGARAVAAAPVRVR